MALNPDPVETDLPEKASLKSGKEATQDRILHAAMDLFMRRGFSRTSVTQIANKAGVSRAAVFWHFSDKDTLFRAAAKEFVVPFRKALGRKLTHLEPRKRVVELITFYEEFVDQNRPNIRDRFAMNCSGSTTSFAPRWKPHSMRRWAMTNPYPLMRTD
jgi:AcrR family transcriptional regulator